MIPNGKHNNWEILELDILEDTHFERVIGEFDAIPKGKYQVLERDGIAIMSNTPDELNDFASFVDKAEGSILITGLGLACVLNALLEKDNVTDITVVEQSEDVIALVAPCVLDKRVTIVNASAFDYVPTKQFNFAWHDIWDGICFENLAEMDILEKHYSPYIINAQEFWVQNLCKQHNPIP